MLIGPLPGPTHLSCQGCAAKSSMLGEPGLVVAPLSLTLFLVFQVRPDTGSASPSRIFPLIRRPIAP